MGSKEAYKPLLNYKNNSLDEFHNELDNNPFKNDKVTTTQSNLQNGHRKIQKERHILEIDPETAVRQRRGKFYYVVSVFIPIVVFLLALVVLSFFIVKPLLEGFYFNQTTHNTPSYPTRQPAFLLTPGKNPYQPNPTEFFGSGHGNRSGFFNHRKNSTYEGYRKVNNSSNSGDSGSGSNVSGTENSGISDSDANTKNHRNPHIAGHSGGATW